MGIQERIELILVALLVLSYLVQKQLFKQLSELLQCLRSINYSLEKLGEGSLQTLFNDVHTIRCCYKDEYDARLARAKAQPLLRDLRKWSEGGDKA